MNEKKLRGSPAAIWLIIGILVAIIKISPLSETLFGISFHSSVAMYLCIAADLLLCYALFTKKLDHWLVIPIAILVLMEFVTLIGYFSLINLLSFASYALMLCLVFILSEQTLIKIDLSKFKDLAVKLSIAPALILGCIWLYFIIISADTGLPLIPRIIIYFNFFFHSIAFFGIISWLKDPYDKNTALDNRTVQTDYGEVYCSLGKHIVLCLFTFGIWYMIWIYRTTKFLNKTPDSQQYNPTSKLLLCLFVPFYQIYWFYKHGQRIDTFTKHKNLNNSDMATLCLILGIFIPVVACIIMQDRINALCTTKAADTVSVPESSTTDELKKYKELLDSGIITQEEFDTKKKHLLGL